MEDKTRDGSSACSGITCFYGQTFLSIHANEELLESSWRTLVILLRPKALPRAWSLSCKDATRRIARCLPCWNRVLYVKDKNTCSKRAMYVCRCFSSLSWRSYCRWADFPRVLVCTVQLRTKTVVLERGGCMVLEDTSGQH